MKLATTLGLNRAAKWRIATGISACLALGTLLGLAACTAPTAKEATTEVTTAAASADAQAETIRKSPNDDRDYRYLTLANGLRVLLVSDKDTDKAAASLVALRGSIHEPQDYPGLAHFLEHMLFIGTKKYPEVSQYQTYIAAHGGSTNAYTALDHTNYFLSLIHI